VNGSTTMTDFQVTRDVAGNPTQVAKLGGAVETYGYDNFGRLADVCFQSSCPNGSDPKIAWTYDSIGRRQTETQPSGTHTYSYNAGDQVTSTTDGSTTTNYTYDADGRETAKGSSSFGYDMASNVTAATVGSTTTSYSYDGQGNRLSASDGTNTTNFLWDENTLNGLPQLARESDGSGNLIRRHLSDAEGASTLQTGAGSFYYLRDQAGSVAKLTDASANTEWSYAYEPFGATKTATKVDPSAPDNPLQFDGQYLDAGSGLYDLRARQYDPNDGRFLSTDPLAPGLTDPYISAYVYSNDQPTMLADPSGMSASSVVGTIMWRATRQAFDGVVRIVNGVGHLMSIGIHVCEMATPWGVLKHLCAPILITVVAFATLSPEALFASESEGLLSTIASREGYESRNIGQWARGILSRFWSKERRSLGGERVAVEEEAAIVNGAGRAYPRVLDPRTGEPIRAPESGLIKVPVADRAAWGAQERAAFIKEWYKRGYSTPEGGWPKYDIHHITPREYGGTNDFNNLVPVLRGTHQQEFNAWWRDYP
jgi:RHS repeat-associated protein